MKCDMHLQEAAASFELPFNRTLLQEQFELAAPDQDPGGEGVWLILQGDRMLLRADAAPRMLPDGDSPLLTCTTPPLYIGRWQGRPCRLLRLPAKAAVPDSLQAHGLRAPEPKLPPDLVSLAGIGQMILHWERTSHHCGDCGELLFRLPGEWGKECAGCGNHHFPRIHPCVIGLVVRDEHILLARKPEWVPARYSLVAGFVEFGESLEEAMAREVLEETGIEIGNIRYLGSQSWPFPSQLMCGFVADYRAGEIELRDGELADADWFSLERLPALPPSRSIARHIIDRAAEFLPR